MGQKSSKKSNPSDSFVKDQMKGIKSVVEMQNKFTKEVSALPSGQSIAALDSKYPHILYLHVL